MTINKIYLKTNLILTTMKKLILMAFICLIALACKKSNTDPQAPVQIVVTGLTAKTSVSIKVVDVTQGNTTPFNITNQFGNTTYSTAPVSPGDQLEISISTNINPDNLQGDGDGSFQYYFKGESMGAHAGIIGSFTQKESVPMP